eukprot:IDg15036t1
MHDTDRISDFVDTIRGTGEFTEEAKRFLITFYALRCGTPDVDTDLLNFTLKTIPRDVRYDDNEVDLSREAEYRGGNVQKKQRTAESEFSAIETRNAILKDGMSAIMQTLAPRQEVYYEPTAKQAKDIAALTKDLNELYILLEDARRKNMLQALIDRIARSVQMTTMSLETSTSPTIVVRRLR